MGRRIGPARRVPATPGPVGWWKFDETAGTIAADSVGGQNGTLLPADPDGKGLGPKWVAGKLDGGLQRRADGTANDYVHLPIGDLINTLESTTFAVWVNWAGSSGGSWQRIFDFGSGTTDLRVPGGEPGRDGLAALRHADRHGRRADRDRAGDPGDRLASSGRGH